MSKIPVKVLREFAREYDQTHLIVFGCDSDNMLHVATYGRTLEQSSEAADFGNKLKEKLGWPEALQKQPSRVRALQRKVKELQKQIANQARNARTTNVCYDCYRPLGSGGGSYGNCPVHGARDQNEILRLTAMELETVSKKAKNHEQQ